MIRELVGRIAEFFATGSDVLTRQVRIVTSRIGRSSWRATHDWSRPDYEFWRRAYYCRARGLELSGLFIKPLVNKIAAWTLGRPPKWTCQSERSQEALDEWWADNHPDVLRAWKAALKGGDAFPVINPDLTITLVPPHLVEPIVSEDDYAEVVGWRIRQVISHPTRPAERMTVTDEYTRQAHTRVVETNGKEVDRQSYPNLIGRLPVVHIANSPDSGETFGHPEAEALVEILHRYGEILEAGVEGNKLQGRPTPVISFGTIADLDKFWANYGTTETLTLPDGTTETTTVLGVDLNQLLTVSDAEFDYKSPGSFATDTEKLLGLMFYLILEHTELPEFVFGNAIASSKASAETQMPVFVEFIKMRQGEMRAWLVEVAEVVLAYLSLMEPGVRAETPVLQFEEMDQQDGTLTLQTVQWAYTEGLIDARTALMTAPITIEDIDAVLAEAEREREERQERQGDPIDRLLQKAIDEEERQAEEEEG